MEETLKEKLPEPELITRSRRNLNIIQAVLIGFRVITILLYVAFSIMGVEYLDGDILKCIVEIGVIFMILHVIKSGYKKIAILPLIGGLISVKYVSESFSLSNGSIPLTLISYFIALMTFFQFASMTYILASKKIEFYCYYALYNKNN
ncbi:hypothetical protein psyc5s11_35840 [Clostridium gelidum]|uniref:Uncharacterized protein n=1 Tax=Clostridium gelidum TaxID=704125 RepID=A0ABN6IZW5_9CLOT|nr:hypothetical protein [Clostridium gelidum]BCZ47517.1 hypothetical protein psyc5s11_35840 [Clostridium gelidum]